MFVYDRQESYQWNHKIIATVVDFEDVYNCAGYSIQICNLQSCETIVCQMNNGNVLETFIGFC